MSSETRPYSSLEWMNNGKTSPEFIRGENEKRSKLAETPEFMML
jgi:hypothetical protein